ncbi:MAG TPA: PAS domain S-box protein, partial [Proteobacteria bacterium]|nr:PAS domain S-box protein [Pseudomonadota bacterium]
VWANRAAGASVGLEPDQLIGRHCYEIWHGRSEPCEGCPVAEAMKTQKVCEKEISTPDGRMWFIKGYPVYDSDGKLVGAVEITQDITRRKQAERSLRESQQIISTLVSNLPGMVYRCRADEHRTMEFVSDGCYRLTGYEPSALVHNKEVSFGQLIHPEDKDRVMAEVKKALEEKRPYELTYRITTAEEEQKWVWERGRGVYSPEAELLYLEGLITDISEQKGTEDALRTIEEKYKAAVELSADNIYIVDAETKQIVEVNQALLNLLGYTAEEMRQLTLYNFVAHPPEDINTRIDEVIKKGKAFIGERRYRRKDGSLVDVEVSASVFTAGTRRLLCVVSRDITERKRVEEKLRLLATRDELTGFLNRRSGILVLEKMMKLAKRDGSKLSICFIDVDDLKDVNDTYGHMEGDRLLKTLAGFIRESLRDTDVVCRLGGDEFLLIFPQCSMDQAEVVWARVESRINAYNKSRLKPYEIKVSRGFAEYDPEKVKSVYGFIGIADERMYRDKRG